MTATTETTQGSPAVPVAQRSGAPVLLINLHPPEEMDHATFDTGAWLAYCGACPLPEMADACEGTVVPGPLLRIGNTTSRLDLGCDLGEWTDLWSASGVDRHRALGTGHRAAELKAVAELVWLESVAELVWLESVGVRVR
ncbi:MAG: L-arabinose isomerase [Pseudonocardiales bacterium]|nr:L-arabinose isomerase [Pseudonocardiales bacterium]